MGGWGGGGGNLIILCKYRHLTIAKVYYEGMVLSVTVRVPSAFVYGCRKT